MIISLCGYMGSGKSTIGKNLAKYTFSDFIDLDDYLEQKLKTTIKEYFTKNGETAFRKEEEKALKEIVLKYKNNTNKNLVLSLGGGAPVYKNSADIIKNQTICVYIKVSKSVLCKRLIKNNVKRPILAGKNNSDIEEIIEKMLLERDPIYREISKKIVDSSHTNISDLVEELGKLF